jgi:hypothetical protein
LVVDICFTAVVLVTAFLQLKTTNVELADAHTALELDAKEKEILEASGFVGTCQCVMGP